MKNILITGFEPFGGEKINPSYEALKLLPETIATAKIHILCLPVVFGKNGALLEQSIDELDPGIRKQCLDVLGIQVDNYGFHRSSFPVRVAVHEVLPDCLRQSVFKNSHDVMTYFSVAADE